MDPVKIEEYAALRATIRERGTARVWLAWAGIVGWATIVSVVASIGGRTLLLLPPLLVLAASFEGVFALHIGVERVGRYLQVVYESAASSLQWETAAMNFGRQFPARGSDPLFTWFFILATLANLLPLAWLASGKPGDLTIVAVAHLAFVIRIIRARRSAAGQRARDLDRFRQLAREHADEQIPSRSA
ncbi:MAG TPA: hypothetical protein VIC33_02195 [Vicinamibacterales bacterium]|jgi:hypothetical protein